MSRQIFCIAYRASTQSSLSVEIPQDIVKAVEDVNNVEAAVDWVMEEFGGQFIPEVFELREEKINS